MSIHINNNNNPCLLTLNKIMMNLQGQPDVENLNF